MSVMPPLLPNIIEHQIDDNEVMIQFQTAGDAEMFAEWWADYGFKQFDRYVFNRDQDG